MEQAHVSDDRRLLEAWFAEFLLHRSTAKPSPHTLKAYRQDFAAISGFLSEQTGVPVSALSVEAITKPSMQQAFASFAATHEVASIRRCWSTWNTLCDYLFSIDTIVANPMSAVLRPKAPKRIPKALPADAVTRLIQTLQEDDTDGVRPWGERDFAIILTALLTGMRSSELIAVDLGDVRSAPDPSGGSARVIRVRGKGSKERVATAEPALVATLTGYLESRIARFPETTKRRVPSGATPWQYFRSTDPLFVGADGTRITRGTLQYRVLRAYRRAGINGERAKGALTHQFRHTFATNMADENVSIFTLMRMLGHESMNTTQVYTEGAGTGVREAAARNPLYRFLDGA
ncbi:recombinase [Prescottella equi]|uniref:Tyrosine-type recombinase/integrase n=1 Tax=Rhodococcus hoagii TaxID=43767 RepID=A0AAE2W7P4_RHOHA|nr:tyrosine-type recombinase/integrase [Prescottella equi]MBM4484758.1 tyrosine-type recombinase/integrase [Prescottella equi]MBM4540768.1 tyrosine-type recombinase/integrase [Prescottella equi]MBM4715371.1 tyrosine-type recombinase/integrase [Prescottella equi]NKR91221.1 tyrosine-type recombinase/integrase [Prescottella equi]